MQTIYRQPNEYGAYPSPQNWNNGIPPSNYVIIPDTLDMTDFYTHNGFVTLEIENGVVTGYSPNIEAWETWLASLPEPVPQADPPSQADMAEMLLDLEFRTSLLEMGVK